MVTLNTFTVIWGAVRKNHRNWTTDFCNCEFATTVEVSLPEESAPLYIGSDGRKYLASRSKWGNDEEISIDNILIASMEKLPGGFAPGYETIYGIEIDGRWIAGGGFDIKRKPEECDDIRAYEQQRKAFLG